MMIRTQKHRMVHAASFLNAGRAVIPLRHRPGRPIPFTPDLPRIAKTSPNHTITFLYTIYSNLKVPPCYSLPLEYDAYKFEYLQK